MTGRVRASLSLAAAAGAVLLLSGATAVATVQAHPFQTGFLDEATFEGSPTLGFERAGEAGATIERLRLNWNQVAPQSATIPSGFDPTNPDDSHYDWSSFDAQVNAAVAAGQTPMANIFALSPPQWALISPGGGLPATYPDPQQIGNFAKAAALRYPQVRYWELWDEPNLGLYVQPQFVNRLAYSAIWYRSAVNDVAAAVKSVNASNFVIAGSTAPFYDSTASTVAVNSSWGPLGFMRAVLCLTPQLTYDASGPGCASPNIEFDAWAHHPYTEGGPTHTATLADDVELGDIPRMKKVLDAAWGLGHIVSPTEPQLWMDEFSWNSDPPDPNGVPVALLERWIPEAMYDMWSDGVTVLTWFQLVDGSPPYQTGFYTSQSALSADQPKPTLEAFRFPFVAYRSAGGVSFWGRTPGGVQDNSIAIEQSDGNGGWTQLETVASDQYGIFQGRATTTSQLPVRARLMHTGESGLPFSLRIVPDRFYPSFGKYQFEPSRTYPARPTITSHTGAHGSRPTIPAPSN